MFKIGDIVKCVNYEHWWHTDTNILTIGKSYEVETPSLQNHKYHNIVCVLADDDEYYNCPLDWFELDVKYMRKQKISRCLR